MRRSRRELSNAYFVAKIGFDTAENEPAKNLKNCIFWKMLPNVANQSLLSLVRMNIGHKAGRGGDRAGRGGPAVQERAWPRDAGPGADLTGSVGVSGPNHSNYSDQSSVSIRGIRRKL